MGGESQGLRKEGKKGPGARGAEEDKGEVTPANNYNALLFKPTLDLILISTFSRK